MSGGFRKGVDRRCALIAAVLAGMSIVVAAPASASPAPVVAAVAQAAASPGHSPIPEFSAANGVSCPRASYCLAVGAYNADGVVRTLTELWNGSEWSVIASPDPKGAVSSVLNAISCSSASSCAAVGSYVDSNSTSWPLTESWNGRAWTIRANPKPQGTFADLSGVSCTSASRCLAVGSYTNSQSVSLTLAELWDGSAWSLLKTPNPSGAQSSTLSAVTCTGKSGCMAVGSTLTSSSVAVPLAERWNGSAWSILAVPQPRGAQGSFLDGVSCPSAAHCLAVGTYSNSNFVSVTLAESWNGSRWSVSPSPTPAGSPSSALYAVSCGTVRCLAVGHSYAASFAGKDGTLAEAWDGSRWSIVGSPSPATNSVLYGVSCAGDASCLAAGAFFNSADNYQTLAEAWNGSMLAIVNQDAELVGVSCVDAQHCVSVGSHFSRSVSAALTEFSNGTARWTVPSPNPQNSEGSYLTAVSCLSAQRCAAVGYYYALDNTRETLVESWNGVRWTIVPSPNSPGAAYSVLYGISCISASRCMAVGSTAGRVLAESWDGSQWTLLPTPDPTTTAYAELNSVTCSKARCLAVGYETDTYYHADLTFAEKWANGSWSIVPSAAPGKNRSLSSVLHGLSCSSTDCLAVGYRQTGSGDFIPLSEHWSGQGWSVLTTPGAASPYSELSAVSCVMTGRCLAVGTEFRSGGFGPFAEQWTGTAWQIVPQPSSPALPSGISYLQGASCVASFTCVAAGAYGNPANLTPLTARWSGSGWSVLRG